VTGTSSAQVEQKYRAEGVLLLLMWVSQGEKCLQRERPDSERPEQRSTAGARARAEDVGGGLGLCMYTRRCVRVCLVCVVGDGEAGLRER
jgi:hypothetical protein